MSAKKRYGKFRKKHYVRIVEDTVDYLLKAFGYRIRPRVRETRLTKNALMMFSHGGGRYEISYDYEQFREHFSHGAFHVQAAYAAAIAAHEMRHYYQHRQMQAKCPRESVKTIKRWQKNEKNLKALEYGDTLSAFFLQALELDAALFEYTFAAEEFDMLLTRSIYDEKHFRAMEKLYVSYYGQTDETLFSKEMWEHLRERKRKTEKDG